MNFEKVEEHCTLNVMPMKEHNIWLGLGRKILRGWNLPRDSGDTAMPFVLWPTWYISSMLSVGLVPWTGHNIFYYIVVYKSHVPINLEILKLGFTLSNHEWSHTISSQGGRGQNPMPHLENKICAHSHVAKYLKIQKRRSSFQSLF